MDANGEARFYGGMAESMRRQLRALYAEIAAHVDLCTARLDAGEVPPHGDLAVIVDKIAWLRGRLELAQMAEEHFAAESPHPTTPPVQR
jgi:hypothetical protein